MAATREETLSTKRRINQNLKVIMRKTTIFIAATLLMAGCYKAELESPINGNPEGRNITIIAGQGESRAYVSEVGANASTSTGSYSLAWDKDNLPFELQVRAGDCSRVTAGQNRAHLGLCPGPSFSLQGRQGSRGCIPDSPGESGLVSRGSK